MTLKGPPQWLSSKESACDAEDTRDTDSIPGSGRSSGGGHDNPLPVFLPGESHGQMSLEGYSPQGRKVSDTTEVTSTHMALKYFLQFIFLSFLT